MFERILAWIASQVLMVLLDRAIEDVKAQQEQLRLDEERRQINEDNIRAYEEAVARADRARAALDLINGTGSLPGHP